MNMTDTIKSSASHAPPLFCRLSAGYMGRRLCSSMTSPICSHNLPLVRSLSQETSTTLLAMSRGIPVLQFSPTHDEGAAHQECVLVHLRPSAEISRDVKALKRRKARRVSGLWESSSVFTRRDNDAVLEESLVVLARIGELLESHIAARTDESDGDNRA